MLSENHGRNSENYFTQIEDSIEGLQCNEGLQCSSGNLPGITEIYNKSFSSNSSEPVDQNYDQVLISFFGKFFVIYFL